MKKYTIHFEGQKTRIRVGSHPSKPTLIEHWQQTIQSHALPAIWHLTDFVYPKYGIPGAHFVSITNQDGLFIASQLEDSAGNFNPKGRFLAQIEVEITVSLNSPAVLVGNLGLPPDR